MTIVIESATSAPSDWLESRLSALPVPNRVVEKQDRKAANTAVYDPHEARQNLVHSRHTHYDPLQVAIEDGLDGWARHAMASNGFGDLP
jgi:hypothetical protein